MDCVTQVLSTCQHSHKKTEHTGVTPQPRGIWGTTHLDHVYTNIRGTNKAAPRSHFGLSDHISVFLYPAYRQRSKQTKPVSTQIKRWTPDTESILQDCIAQTDCDVFKAAATQEDSSINIELYAEYATGYISTLH
ncbi:hypothetical protein L3Q82_003518 [Scortum barcoo]|uniref:Uncharacterized protein n=1 Tax=Scortum barcoo TaxID=214431 RepID=A0ACB8VQS9_9TELE|nr:hypothetical protein L3Q82_003518 [Scortum barcoo]